MAAKYWLKLYHEMLDDPKVARLPDSSYRRFIECLLLAGELNEGGLLPPIEDMAWRVRVDETSLGNDMSRLALAGIVELSKNDRWFVTSFEKRQKGLSKAEYMKRLREERQKSYQGVTEGVTISNADKDIDIDKEYIYTPKSPQITQPEYLPEPIHETANQLAAICKTPYVNKNEEDYHEAAYWLHGNDVTKEQLTGFTEWWQENGFYRGKPALKSILDEWHNYTNGISTNGEKPEELKFMVFEDET